MPVLRFRTMSLPQLRVHRDKCEACIDSLQPLPPAIDLRQFLAEANAEIAHRVSYFTPNTQKIARDACIPFSTRVR